jgi:hypothetical protein
VLTARDEVVELLLRFLTASLRGAYDQRQQLAAARRLQLPALHACALLVQLPPRPPPKLLNAIVQGLLQLLQADVLAAKPASHASEEDARHDASPAAPPNGVVAAARSAAAAAAAEAHQDRMLMGVCHAGDGL